MKQALRKYIYILFLVTLAMYMPSLAGKHVFRAEAASGMVTGSVVNIRSGPGTTFDVAGSLYQDSEVEILSQSGEWYQIKFGAVSGWLHQSLVQVESSPADIEITVSKDLVNLRSGPGTTYSIIGEAAKGDVLILIDVVDEWYKVKTASGQVVYIRSDMTANASASGSAGSKISTSVPGNTTSPITSSGSVSSAVSAGKVPTITLDGRAMQFDVAPRVENNRVLVPLRAIFEAMGATVVWNQAAQTATATLGDTRVILPLNSTSPTVNGKIWPLDVPAKVVNQRTLAPLRFVGEALGGRAEWDGENYEVILTSPAAQEADVVAVTVNSPLVNLRSGPGTTYTLVGEASAGERLKVLDETNGWYQVSWSSQKAWVAGWLVTVVREGDPAAEPVISPIVDPTPAPVVTLDGLTISSERTEAGLRIMMESGKKLSTDLDKTSGQVRYEFANRRIEGENTLVKYLSADKLTVTGSNSGSTAIVNIQFPAGTLYETSTENSGKREVFTVPNYIASISRKTFGSSGENITITSIAPLAYTSSPSANKLEVVLKDCLLGEAQSSYRYSRSLISGMSFKTRTVSGQTDTVLTINTSQAVKFSVGTSNDDSTLNILFIEKSIIESRVPLVVLDAGHGGRDPGAIGDGGLTEKEVNLDLVLKTGELLKDEGIKVVYTRKDDTYVSLEERATMANLLNAAVFVSVHNNASERSDPSGTETYCYYPLSDPSLYLQKEERCNLARLLQEALVKRLGRIDRGIKQGNLAVLRETDMPSALVEMVFISNPEEEALLKRDSFLDKGAQALAEAIADYMEEYVNDR